MLVAVGGPELRDQACFLDRPGARMSGFVVAEVLEVQVKLKLVGPSRLHATRSLNLPLCLSHSSTLIVIGYYLAEGHLSTRHLSELDPGFPRHRYRDWK